MKDKEKDGHNHEVWVKCRKCGCEVDIRLGVICPNCGTTISISDL